MASKYISKYKDVVEKKKIKKYLAIFSIDHDIINCSNDILDILS